MAILWGRRRSDSAWLARPTAALTRRGPHGDDAVGPISALSHRSNRAQMLRRAQSTPHHFRRRDRRSAIRALMAGAAATNCVSVVPAASVRLALCAQKNGPDSAPGRFRAPVGVVKGRPQ